MPPHLPESSQANASTTPQPDARPEQKAGGPVMEIEGVYIIMSEAVRILDMHPQTLRKYERLGFISPGRTMGMWRLYSRDDIRKLRLIRHLVDNLGLNLAGVELTLSLVDKLLDLHQRLAALTVGSPLQAQVEREIDQLFRSLNLPVEEY